MRTRLLGGLEVSELGLGCMGMSEFYGGYDDEESIRTIRRALDAGITLIDTADMYGAGDNERLVGRALEGRRDEAVVATKFGNMRGPNREFLGVNGRPEYVRGACDASLLRLGVDEIDLYQQHRVDPKVPIEETVGAMHELVEAGKVRFLGLSEAQPEDIRRAAAIAPIASLQSEYSLFTRDVERPREGDGDEPAQSVLETCAEHGIGFLAYAPLGRGMLAGRFRSPDDFAEDDARGGGRYPRMSAEHFETNMRIVAEVEQVAAAHGATPAQVALAWLLSRPAGVVPIPGTKRVRYLEENAAAADLELTDEDLERLDALPDAVGDRYPAGRTPGWVSPPQA